MVTMVALLVAALCPPQQLVPAKVAPGEVLQYKLDVVGVDAGTFDLRTEAPPPAEQQRAGMQLTSRAKTSAFVSTNMGRFDAYATALIARDFTPLRYREDIDESAVHRGLELSFPPEKGKLAVRATKNGEPEPFTVPASEAVRDILSTLYLVRRAPFSQPVCLEVFATRKIWKLTGRMVAKETIETPLGRFASLRFEGEAVRVDDPAVKRAAFLWVTDDDRRLLLAGIAEVRGKTIRAQLVSAAGMRRAARK
jgi:Protein of unknown function (DUF3108)